ncbi:MAG: S-methyl-5'-thioadenosine phosphorylase [Candidatus Verstraetearchaeota archaeon]|nr:S-methyl-5'-thioadenosine phosphorylase [Candidatus Verstraetearchaeota archaeon]
MSLSPQLPKVEIGIIGGSGFYDPVLIEDAKELKIATPYGPPSDTMVVGRLKGVPVAFLPRHGRRHSIPPHKINYRANIWAMRELGVKRIIAPSAVGSLREDYKPGDLVLPDQFIDFTKKREYSFYEGAYVGHFSLADPFCPELREVFYKTSLELNLPIHEKGTYICIEGPRFSTRAESKLFRSWGADIIGMTLVPEVVLAREVEICYLTIAMVTDYDVWAEKPVSAEEVAKTMAENVDKVKKLLYEAIPRIPKERRCLCSQASKEAII